MNVNPDKIKELVLRFSELNGEYQEKLLNEAYKLYIMQCQLKNINKEKKEFKTEMELQNEIDKRTNEALKDAVELIKRTENMSDTDKASLMIMINRLAGDGNKIKESDIEITLKHKEISIEEYLKMTLPRANYQEADEFVTDYMRKINA